MPDHLVWHVGNRDPSISETITDSAGIPVDVSGKTIRFRCREVGSDMLLVDQPASFVTDGTDGQVKYDWQAADIVAPNGALSAERTLLEWWQVSGGGKSQDMAEAIIYVDAHAPDGRSYVEVAELKKTIELERNFADLDIRSSLIAASRAIEKRCYRRSFWPDTADQERFYRARRARLWIDDLFDVTEVATDAAGDGTWNEVWTENVDYTFEPENAEADGRPFESLIVHPLTTKQAWPFDYPRAVRITGKFGWPAVPESIKTATSMLAVRLLRQKREAPFGIVAVGLEGQAVRISRTDPQVAEVLLPYVRTQVLA